MKKVSIDSKETAKPPTPSELKLELSKKRSAERYNALKKNPPGHRNSIAVQKASDLIRSEFKELMAK